MDSHKNARLTPKGREEMVRAVVDRGMSNAAAARQFNTTPKTVGKWVGRFCAEGVDSLCDRSSRPLSSPAPVVVSAPTVTTRATTMERMILYRVPEIVTRGRFPDGGESDSTWRTQEARHVGSDTIAPGF